MLRFDDLQLFVRAADLGSLSAAARVMDLSPAVANTTVQLQYSFGEQRPGSDSSASFGKLVSANVLHASGPLTLGAGFIRVTDADGAAPGKQGKDALMVVGAYDLGAVKLSAYMNQEDKAAEKLKLVGVAAARAGALDPDVRMVYAAASAARLEVSVATLATRAALLSMSCDSVVQSLVAAALRLSRYPSSLQNVSSEIGRSLLAVTVLASR